MFSFSDPPVCVLVIQLGFFVFSGTSACPAGKFYCRNIGSTPQFLFSSRVNDHFCGKHHLYDYLFPSMLVHITS